MKVKADRDESSPYAAMVNLQQISIIRFLSQANTHKLAAQDVAVRCKEVGITALHIKIRATGGEHTLNNHSNAPEFCNFTMLTFPFAGNGTKTPG